jgi:hypothetical protein
MGRYRLLDATYVSLSNRPWLLVQIVCAECDSLADGGERYLREEGKECQCKDGWGGINCNGPSIPYFVISFPLLFLVCQTDNACANFPIKGDLSSLDATDSVNMTCYKDGETVFNNHQFCDVTSTRISTHVLISYSYKLHRSKNP